MTQPDQPDLFRPDVETLEIEWTTDLAKLTERLREEGWRIVSFSFPKPNTAQPGVIKAERARKG